MLKYTYMVSAKEFSKKTKQLQKQYKLAISEGKTVALRKKTTNLFRARRQEATAFLDVSLFTNVISINKHSKTAEVEGMATYETIVAETLRHGLMPAVVPQLKTITLGGAVTGVGIESSSWRYGFPHETVESMEILLGNGDIVVATATNNHKDLFFGFPNSYGSLGYALKLKIKLVAVKKYVKLQYYKFGNSKEFLSAFKDACKQGQWNNAKFDFIDGMIYKKGQYYMIVATMTDNAPYLSDYKSKHIFYKSIISRSEDYLTISDYIWRWDTDWFWCSQNLGAQNKFLRKLYGKKRLRSDFYMKLFGLEKKYGINAKLSKLLKKSPPERVIQDVEIPIENTEKFLDYYFKTINILPVWVCPIKQTNAKVEWSLYKIDPNRLYLNFGFWSSVKSKKSDPFWHNKSLESKVGELKGKKSLYSDVFYDEKTFWRLYNKQKYSILKKHYDKHGFLKDLYQKTVKRG